MCILCGAGRACLCAGPLLGSAPGVLSAHQCDSRAARGIGVHVTSIYFFSHLPPADIWGPICSHPRALPALSSAPLPQAHEPSLAWPSARRSPAPSGHALGRLLALFEGPCMAIFP